MTDMSATVGKKTPSASTSTGPTMNLVSADRMAKSAIGPSPLKIFGNAKKRIRDIFNDVDSYISEVKTSILGMNDDRLVSEAQKEKVNGYTDKVAGIREVLTRDHMKVVFFGRTSNGKSTTINSLLRAKILPSGIGHTTHCFVQVEGTDSSEGYLLVEGSEEQRNVHSLKELANALSSVKLQPNSLIRICWPKAKCSLLKDDVVLVDSPGIDVTPDLDSWIDKYCLDADVFILVANAESTLMQTEKNFFLKVSDRLSKPTVFVLNNRWDASASEPDMMEEVRAQHMERNIEFLCNELKVVNPKEAEERIFFVSAKEALHNRLAEAGVTVTPSPVLEGFQGRLFEFASFERKFEECLSRSAVKTKFAQHARKGKLIVSELKELTENLLDNAMSNRETVMSQRQILSANLTQLEQQINQITTEMEADIQNITENVERKVSQALSEEITRLSILVGEFNRPFHSDSLVLEVYKRELHAHVEEGLGRNIQARCSAALTEAVQTTEQAMTDKLVLMLPTERQSAAKDFMTDVDKFQVEYRLDARNLCADFREDIQFRFTWSITSLVERYLGRKLFNSATICYSQQPTSIPPSMPPADGPSAEVSATPTAQDELVVALMRAAPALASTSTVTVVVLGGAIYKAVGWKIVALVGGAYGLLYAYERLMWSNRAKERTFKRQYVNFAGSKLRMIIDLTSANAGHQVQQELNSTFNRLKHEVNQVKVQLREDITKMDTDLTDLDSTASRSKILRNKAGWLDNEINDFISRFIEYS